MKALLLVASMLIASAQAHAAALPPTLRLYTLDCGRIDFENEKVFDDTDEHDSEKGVMPVSCFGLAAHFRARVVIRHATDVFEQLPRLAGYLQ